MRLVMLLVIIAALAAGLGYWLVGVVSRAVHWLARPDPRNERGPDGRRPPAVSLNKDQQR